MPSNRKLRPPAMAAAYLETGASQYAGMLAFSLFVSLLPLFLGVLAIWGLAARGPQRLVIARRLLVDVFPQDAQGVARDALLAAGQHAGALSLLSLVGMAWFATGLFSTAGFVLNRIHGLPHRSFIAQRLRGLWLVVALVVAINAAVGANVLVRVWSLPTWLGALAVLLAVTGLVVFIYRYAPSRRLDWAAVMPGAAVAGVAIVAISYLLPILGRLSSPLSSESRFFATAAVLVTWVYAIAQAVLMGAVVNRVRLTSR